MNFNVERDVPAEMRDGVVLRADVYRPAGGGSYPVLVMRTPYDKRGGRNVQHARELAARGYVVVAQDIRGRYASDGEFLWQFRDNSEVLDGPDGYDTVEWAASLTGSDGQVGTWGHSYPTWCIWRMAETQPPSLKAIFAGGISMRLLDLNSGVFETARRLQWTHRMAVDARQRAGGDCGSGPRTADEADEQWRTDLRGKWVWYTPLDDIPDDVFSTLTPQLRTYLREQNLEHWALDKVLPKVSVPTCSLTGWWDRLIGTVDMFAGLVANGPEAVRGEHRLIIGPWGHNVGNMGQRQGPLDFGPGMTDTYADVIARWYDYRLKGIDDGMGSEPPVKLFVVGRNEWRYEEEWPPEQAQSTEFFLHSEGKANTVSGDGVLSTNEPGEERPDSYTYDPRDPVMSLMDADAQAAPRDQAPNDGRADVLVYQTPPLEQEVEVIGPMVLKLWASTSAPDTDFTAKLIDVHPDGLAVNLTYGIVRARYREGYNRPELLEPGRPHEFTIRLNPVGVRFLKGHRIRLDVSSSDFPNFDRNHNTGADFWSDAEFRAARQTLYHDRERPSRLVLPLMPL